MIPVYIFHLGNQLYFQRCVEINSRKNKVYVIGDDTNKDSFKDNTNVTHIHVNTLNNQEIDRMKKCFVNYSTNKSDFELNCFMRVFYLKHLMEITGITSFFHLDSDCILLEDLHKIIFKSPIAYSLQKHMVNPYHMTGSIHNGLLNMAFCKAYIELYFDIFESKKKMNLIKRKISWHKAKDIGGGICDMTLYWLLYSEKLIEVSDLNDLHYIDEHCTFDHRLSDSYGYLGNQTYSCYRYLKILDKKHDKIYFKTQTNIAIRALSLHFMGEDKKLLETWT